MEGHKYSRYPGDLCFWDMGVIDGYRKGFVKKGILFGISISDTGAGIYGVSLCGRIFPGDTSRSVFSGECTGNGQWISTDMLVLSGFGDEAEKYMYVMASQSSFGGSYLSDSKTPPEDV